MTRKPKIVAYTRWSKGGHGEYPLRYVILDWGKNAAHRWSRHAQVKDGIHPDYFIWGHYFCAVCAAFADLEQTVAENRKGYYKESPTYIPLYMGQGVYKFAKGYRVIKNRVCEV